MKTKLTFVFLFVTTITLAQNNLFSNISTTDRYQRFPSVYDEDGNQEIKDGDLIVKFNIETIPTGEGYKLEVFKDIGNSKGSTLKSMDALNGYSTCIGYPYESYIRHNYNKDAFVAIGDYVFQLDRMSKNGVSYGSVSYVFIKIDEATSNAIAEKKTEAKPKTIDYGAAYKALKGKDLNKFITDYLVEMKAKQDTRTAAEKRNDNSLKVAKSKGDEEIKRYNDSIKATTEYKKMKEHQARMENMSNKV